MLELIQNIGKQVKNIKGEYELVDLWQKSEKEFDSILEINVDENKEDFSVKVRAFYPEVFRETLFYRQGRGHIGSAFKIEKFKENKAARKKIRDRISSCFKFMEIDEKLAEKILEAIINEAKSAGNKSFIVTFLKNSKKAEELYQSKFIETVEKTYLNKKNEVSNCHVCGKKSEVYNTAVYKCYTNDKEIYSNTDDITYGMCRDCTMNILLGKKYIEEILKTYWAGSEVMFLPHEYNEEIAEIYEYSNIGKAGNTTTLLNNIRSNESEILDIIGTTGTMTDILFFYDNKSKSEWKIEYHIRDVLPSRFKIVSENLNKYRYRDDDKPLNLGTVMNYLCVNKEKKKERMRLLDIILHGKKYSRNLFFRRVMKKYKKDYYAGKKSMSNIHRIYNFLCDCKCLERPWYYVYETKGGWKTVEYKTVEDFFEKNKEYFDSNDKKAWFLLGRLYSNAIYHSKKYKTSDGSNVKDESSHLEKNFFFGRKFDFKTFVYFSNLCIEKLTKYGVYSNNSYLKKLASMAKEYMKLGQGDLSSDEAKYIFFWGMDFYINNKKEEE